MKEIKDLLFTRFFDQIAKELPLEYTLIKGVRIKTLINVLLKHFY